jgi:cytochrome P450
MDRVFPRGLMMMDYDEHRLHRRALSVAFKAGPMQAYLHALNTGIAARVANWRATPGQMLFYPAMKQLTLDLAATSFLGTGIGPESEGLARAFVDMVAATIAPVRRPLPGTQMRRGMRGRAHIVEFFSRQVPLRREAGGEDLFSQLCRATTEDGALLSPAAVVDHMSFFMMAAHDTLTSSLSAFVMMLAANPGWQTMLRDEIASLGLRPGEALAFDRLEDMKLTEMAFKETLRMIPPVPLIPRRALRDFTFMGFTIPAGTSVGVNPLFTHYMPELWPEPSRFDPSRFAEAAQAGRHRYAFVPYGGGAHMCLGLHFAYMQAKCFARHFLQNLCVALPAGGANAWRMWPIPKPKDGLPVILAPA